MSLLLPRIAAAHRNLGTADPYWANVVLLMQLDGADGSTVFTDSKGHVFSAGSGSTTAISTAQAALGSASLHVDGTSNGYISTASSADFAFGTGDFTIECFVRPDALTPTEQILVSLKNSSASINNNVVSMQGGKPAWSNGSVWRTSSTALTALAWTHLAVARASGTLRIFQAGVKTLEIADTTALTGNRPCYVGASDFATTRSPYKGYLDGLRVTNGVARYTANFAPPTSYPTH